MKSLLKLSLIILVFSSLAFAREPSFGRASVIDGDAMIFRAADGEWGYLILNMIIEEGDIIRTEYCSRVEVQFENGTLLRLDENTRVRFLTIALIPEAREEDITIQLCDGNTMVEVPWNDEMTYFTVEAGDAYLTISEGSTVRINYTEGGRLYVYVIEGSAQLTTSKETCHLGDGDAVRVSTLGYVYEISPRFCQDEFTEWCNELDHEYRCIERMDYLPHRIYIGYVELARYGNWRYVPGFGWVWVPRVEPGWRPFYHGRWVWTVSWGWVWVPFEPWGFVVFHYGRWAYVAGIGWVWVPGDVWGPGWVAWAWGPDWVAWIPLDPWDRPLIYIDIDVWCCVSQNSFVDPIYIHQKPVAGVYKNSGYEFRKMKVEKAEWKKIQPREITPVAVVTKANKTTAGKFSVREFTAKKKAETADVKAKSVKSHYETARVSTTTVKNSNEKAKWATTKRTKVLTSKKSKNYFSQKKAIAKPKSKTQSLTKYKDRKKSRSGTKSSRSSLWHFFRNSEKSKKSTKTSVHGKFSSKTDESSTSILDKLMKKRR